MVAALPNSLEPLARTLLAEHWPALARGGSGVPVSPDAETSAVACTVVHHLPDLLALVSESHDRPAYELAPAVRRLLRESEFIDENGDPMIPANHDQEESRLVEVLVRVLERVRRTGIERGLWSDAPVTPLMCG